MKRRVLAIILAMMLCLGMLAGCGEKECEHEWTEANYQTPATCTICGEVDGEVLTPDFVTYGIDTFIEPGSTYNYRTICADGINYTVGKATVTHTVMPDGEDYEAREGYEWHRYEFEVLFDDDNAKTYGASANFLCENYYDIKNHDDTADHSDPDISVYTANINGVDTPVYLRQGGSFVQNADYSATLNLTIEVQVPAGYDGIVVGLVNQALLSEDPGYINNYYTGDPEDFLLVRVK